MCYFKKYVFTALLLLATMIANAQQTSSISLTQLLYNVYKNDPTLITDSSAILIRKAQATETENSWLPNLKLNYQSDVGTSNNITGPYFGFGIIPSSSGGIHTTNVTTALSTSLGIVSFDWEIYNFGAYKAQNRVARSEVQVEKNNFALSKYQKQTYTIINYLQLLHLQNYLEIQYRNIQRNQEILKSISSLTKSGIIPGVDTSIANAELSKARLNYIELNNQLKQVQIKLSTISGLPYQNIVADTTIETQLNNLSIAESTDTNNHPLIYYYQSIYENNKQKENLVKKEYNPKILLEGAAWTRGSSVDAANNNYNSLSSGFSFDRNNYLVGLGISYNLFDLSRRHLKLQTQKMETNYARNKIEEQKNLLIESINQANAEMETAKLRLIEIPNQLKAANDSYRQQLSLYKNGLSNIIDLDAALNILYRAETDYAQAKYDYNKALFDQAVTQNQVNTILNLLK